MADETDSRCAESVISSGTYVVSEVLPVDRRMRGTLALGIVGGGIALASVFGRADRPPGLETPFPSGPVPLRRRLEVLTPPLSSQDPGAVASEQIPLASVARSVTVEKHPAIAEAPTPDILPPTLAKSFPAIPVPTSPGKRRCRCAPGGDASACGKRGPHAPHRQWRHAARLGGAIPGRQRARRGDF